MKAAVKSILDVSQSLHMLPNWVTLRAFYTARRRTLLKFQHRALRAVFRLYGPTEGGTVSRGSLCRTRQLVALLGDLALPECCA